MRQLLTSQSLWKLKVQTTNYAQINRHLRVKEYKLPEFEGEFLRFYEYLQYLLVLSVPFLSCILRFLVCGTRKEKTINVNGTLCSGFRGIIQSEMFTSGMIIEVAFKSAVTRYALLEI